MGRDRPSKQRLTAKQIPLLLRTSPPVSQRGGSPVRHVPLISIRRDPAAQHSPPDPSSPSHAMVHVPPRPPGEDHPPADHPPSGAPSIFTHTMPCLCPPAPSFRHLAPPRFPHMRCPASALPAPPFATWHPLSFHTCDALPLPSAPILPLPWHAHNRPPGEDHPS